MSSKYAFDLCVTNYDAEIILDELPYDLSMEGIAPQYTEIEGWNSSLDAVETYDQLPSIAKDYVSKLEEMLETRISMVSTGPERRKLLVR